MCGGSSQAASIAARLATSTRDRGKARIERLCQVASRWRAERELREPKAAKAIDGGLATLATTVLDRVARGDDPILVDVEAVAVHLRRLEREQIATARVQLLHRVGRE